MGTDLVGLVEFEGHITLGIGTIRVAITELTDVIAQTQIKCFNLAASDRGRMIHGNGNVEWTSAHQYSLAS